jgi:hypothetical protein
MGSDVWYHMEFLHHKVRNMVRRGYLLKTYYDQKLMQGRFKTGVEIENDRIDIMHPVGFLGRVAPGEKVEMFSTDVGGDPSRRVVLGVLGDRAKHPKIDEGEAILYAPGHPDKFIRVRQGKKKDGQQSSGSGGGGGGGESNIQPQPESEKKEGAIETDANDVKITSNTKETNQRNADKGQGFSTKDGSVEIKAGQNTQFAAQKHIRKGDHHVEGNTYTSGVEHAADHIAGGSTNISEGGSSAVAATASDSSGSGGSDKPDGSKPWTAQGKPGTVSLLAVAAAAGDMASQFTAFKQEQKQQNEQTNAQIEDLDERLKVLEGEEPPAAAFKLDPDGTLVFIRHVRFERDVRFAGDVHFAGAVSGP